MGTEGNYGNYGNYGNFGSYGNFGNYGNWWGDDGCQSPTLSRWNSHAENH